MFGLLFPVLIAGVLAGGAGTTLTLDGASCHIHPNSETTVRPGGDFAIVLYCEPGRAMITVDGRATGVTLDVLPGHNYLELVVEVGAE